MSAYATTRRLRGASNAGDGYVPPARNAPPEMLKQPGGNTQTGLTSVANWIGADHVAPPSVDLATYRTVPLPPCRPLSNVRYASPFGAVTSRWSWLLRMLPTLTFTGPENERPPSVDVATSTGECVPCKPSNCAHVTQIRPLTGSTWIDS